MKISHFLFGVFTFFGLQAIIYQHGLINSLKQEIQISNKMKQIDQDQIRDLIYEITKINQDSQTIAVSNYVAGVVECLSKKDHYYEIWHNGFDNGFNNKQMIDSIANQKEENNKVAIEK